MAAPDERNPRWEAVLEARGVEAVRNLLARSPGTGAGSVVPGLGDAPGEHATSHLCRKLGGSEGRGAGGPPGATRQECHDRVRDRHRGGSSGRRDVLHCVVVSGKIARGIYRDGKLSECLG